MSAQGGVGHDSFHVVLAAGGGGRIDIGGGGADVCAFDLLGAAGAPTGTVRPTGFGADDRIDLSGLLDTAAATGGYQSGEPFAGGWFALVARGADTVLRFDVDGAAGDAHDGTDIATLVGLAPAQIGADMLITDHGADCPFVIRAKAEPPARRPTRRRASATTASPTPPSSSASGSGTAGSGPSTEPTAVNDTKDQPALAPITPRPPGPVSSRMAPKPPVAALSR